MIIRNLLEDPPKEQVDCNALFLYDFIAQNDSFFISVYRYIEDNEEFKGDLFEAVKEIVQQINNQKVNNLVSFMCDLETALSENDELYHMSLSEIIKNIK